MIWKPGDNYPSNSRGEQLDIADGELLSDDECLYMKVPSGSIYFPDDLLKSKQSFRDKWVIVDKDEAEGV